MKDKQRQNWENTIEMMKLENQLELAEILVKALESDAYKFSGDDWENVQTIISVLKYHITKSEMDAIFEGFHNITREKQIEVFKSFLDDIKESYEEECKNRRVLECEENGHQFDKAEWIEKTYLDLERADFRAIYICPAGYKYEERDDKISRLERDNGKGTLVQQIKNKWNNKVEYSTSIDEKNCNGSIYWLSYSTKWERTCPYCKTVETSYSCPKEITEAREKAAREEEKKKLKKRLAEIEESEAKK